jgi:hypothetical protein
MCLREKIGPDPRNFNQRVSLGRNDLLIRTFLNNKAISVLPLSINAKCSPGKPVADKAYLFAVDLHFAIPINHQAAYN